MVAKAFIDNIDKLHGTPKILATDREDIHKLDLTGVYVDCALHSI